ncbi:MAG TPA: family 43 glycosylhydrolase [Phototrophicaceae bacterium]|nr:family 43 glycosylhydrolase [Phototrophicaceae bacterium]
MKTLVKLFLVLVSFLLVVETVGAQSEQSGTLRNPLNLGGPDPWLTYYEGNYYLAATTWTSEWTMRKSPTLAGLKTAVPQRIYFETDPARCCNFWAPEFRLLDGPNGPRWYFYYTAGTRDTYDNQRSYMLESAGTDPMGPYTFKGRLFDPQNDGWSIDGSVLELNGSLYFLFSSFVGGLQSLFIAPMSDPWTISGERTLISKPEYPWEQLTGFVNEGPVALYHDDQTFIVYSASACSGPDYQLGLLTYTGGDPLQAESWVKNPEPVFQRSDESGVFAPGHNGFFKSPDGTEDWIVYHANDSVSGACDGRRTTRVQKFTWNDDGTPNFGVPVSFEEVITAPSGDTGTDPLPEIPAPVISRFKAFGRENAYLRHANFYPRVDANPVPLADSQFVIVPGLADVEAISIESVNFPGFYIRHQNNALRLMGDDGSASYKADATWTIQPGLADDTWISFESYNQPNYYIGRQFGVMALVELTDKLSETAREDATFFEEKEQ